MTIRKAMTKIENTNRTISSEKAGFYLQSWNTLTYWVFTYKGKSRRTYYNKIRRSTDWEVDKK